VPDFALFDADNHFYEPTDAFTRHLDPALRRRTMQWAEVEGKTRLLVGGTVNRFIPNPTFEYVSKPGALTDFFRATQGVGDLRAALSDVEPITDRPEYRDRDARLALMDEQGIEGCIMLPTLGVGMEAALEHDPEAMTAAFTAFNRWLAEDWGYSHLDRIYGAPYVSLIDVDWAVRELQHAIDHDAGVVLMRPGSVWGPDRRRTPGHPDHDPFWRLLDESGITLVVHGGESSYDAYSRIWGLHDEFEAFRVPLLKRMLSASPIHDMVASLFADRLFDRFSNLRIATIETGSTWVKPLLKKLRAVSIQLPHEFPSDPVERFREHLWVSPFFEDDVVALVDHIGADHVVFGSDYPHVEGIAEPAAFAKELDGLAEADVRKIMHDNARALVTRRPA
jgi:predicted TIM-barrel fold metal-dependent hydrolase